MQSNSGGAIPLVIMQLSNAYTKHGYIPVKLVSISPDKNTRITREFIFN